MKAPGFCFLAPATMDEANRVLFSSMKKALEHRALPKEVCNGAYAAGDVAEDAEAQLVVVFDGWLHSASDRGDLSAQTVLARYARLGESFVQELYGDFALVLWDGKNKKVFAARSPSAVRPLYWSVVGGSFRAASELRAVVGADSFSAVDETFVAQLVFGDLRNRTQTLLQSIKRVPPGKALTCFQGVVREYTWWKPALEEEQTLLSPDGISLVREALHRAVVARSAGTSAVACDLSGGVDSSSVLCLAAAAKEQKAITASLLPISIVFPGRSCDEQKWSRQVIEHWKLPWIRAEAPLVTAEELLEDARSCLDFPGIPPGSMRRTTYRVAREQHAPVLLTGIGGDQWYTTSGRFRSAIELLKSGRFTRAMALLRNSDVTKFSSLLPVLRGSLGDEIPEKVSWFTPSFLSLLASVPSERLEHGPALSFRRQQLRQGMDGWSAWAAELEERTGAQWGVEVRSPLEDRRVCELLLRVPLDGLRRQGQSKWVLREAMKGWLPEPVRQRKDKVHFNHYQEEFLLERRNKGVVPVRCARAGWVRMDGWEARDLRQEPSGTERFCEMMVYVLELWLTGLELRDR